MAAGLPGGIVAAFRGCLQASLSPYCHPSTEMRTQSLGMVPEGTLMAGGRFAGACELTPLPTPASGNHGTLTNTDVQ